MGLFFVSVRDAITIELLQMKEQREHVRLDGAWGIICVGDREISQGERKDNAGAGAAGNMGCHGLTAKKNLGLMAASLTKDSTAKMAVKK